MKISLILMFLFCQFPAFAQSYRGLAVINDSTAWISGSKGHVLLTNNGGQSWDTLSPKGYESKDFRDIHAWNEENAIIMSSGAEARILKTRDGGKSWKEVYANNREGVFLDALDFDGGTGVVIGDPYKQETPKGIKMYFDLLISTDSGESWQQGMQIEAMEAEALYAASGTNIVVEEKGQQNNSKPQFFFVTGGGEMNRYLSAGNFVPVPLMTGEAAGIYSFCRYKKGDILVAVGGSYLKPDTRDSVAAFLNPETRQWQLSETQPGGYRSCVCLNKKTGLLATTGTNGTDISKDGGKNWASIETSGIEIPGAPNFQRPFKLYGFGFNVCGFSENYLWLAGNRVEKLIMKE